MKNTPILLFALFFTLSFSSAQAHPHDYIITTKGDTVAAAIKVNFWSGKVVYQLPGSTTTERMDAENVKEYYWSEKKDPTFVAMVLPGRDKPVFATLLVRGKIDLYEYISHSGKGSSKYWYASKGNLPVVEINNEKLLFGVNKKLKKNLAVLLSDNQQVMQYLNGGKYNFKSIKSLIEQYNAS